MRTLIFTLLPLFAWNVQFRARASENSRQGFVVIVNKRNTVTEVEPKWLREIFLKKKITWVDGRSIKPADLTPNSPARRAFSEQVLGRSVAAVRNYWQQRIFSGRGVPPPELNTDEEMAEYVNKHSDAIGYVSDEADVSRVKVLKVK